MDERVLTIIKSMAMGYLAEDDQGYTCIYCDSRGAMRNPCKDVPEFEDLYHPNYCPVVIARQWLRDNGTPLNIYRMTGNRIYMVTKDGPVWKCLTAYTLATSEQEALSNWTNDSIRDLHATFVRELPL